jgi:hypothetical protein
MGIFPQGDDHMDAKRARWLPGLVIALLVLALIGASLACRTITVDFTGTQPGATAVLRKAGTPDLALENERLKTRVASLEATLQASPSPKKTQPQATTEQAVETSQAQQNRLFRQNFAPLVFAGALLAPERLVSGSVVLEGGRCCAGGVAGEVIEVAAEFQAASQVAEVTEMRVRPGSQFYDEQEMQAAPWEPFMKQKTFSVPVVINWVGFYVSVQYRDAQGNISPVYYDDISIEGSPAPFKLTPTIEVPPNP